jgi:hypothetical protein
MMNEHTVSNTLHPYPSYSVSAAEKDLVGRWIMKLSIFFIIVTSFCPFGLLFYNSIIIQQPHSIWWLKPYLNPVAWKRKPKIRDVEIDGWPAWAETHRALNAQFDDLVDLGECLSQPACLICVLIRTIGTYS